MERSDHREVPMFPVSLDWSNVSDLTDLNLTLRQCTVFIKVITAKYLIKKDSSTWKNLITEVYPMFPVSLDWSTCNLSDLSDRNLTSRQGHYFYDKYLMIPTVLWGEILTQRSTLCYQCLLFVHSWLPFGFLLRLFSLNI